MALTAATASGAVQNAVTAGLAAVDVQLQAQFNSATPDIALVHSLNGLRSRYVLDQMQLNRAQVNADDASPQVAQLLSDLSDACDSLNQIQAAGAATTKWINNVSSALDNAFGVFNKIASL